VSHLPSAIREGLIALSELCRACNGLAALLDHPSSNEVSDAVKRLLRARETLDAVDLKQWREVWQLRIDRLQGESVEALGIVKPTAHDVAYRLVVEVAELLAKIPQCEQWPKLAANAVRLRLPPGSETEAELQRLKAEVEREIIAMEPKGKAVKDDVLGMAAIMKVYAGKDLSGLSRVKEIIDRDDLTVQEKLVEWHRTVKIPLNASAKTLAEACKVTAGAVKKTKWWKKHMKWRKTAESDDLARRMKCYSQPGRKGRRKGR